MDEVRDRMALQHLVTAYGHGIDRRDYGLLASLYHDDAVDDHSAIIADLRQVSSTGCHR